MTISDRMRAFRVRITEDEGGHVHEEVYLPVDIPIIEVRRELRAWIAESGIPYTSSALGDHLYRETSPGVSHGADEAKTLAELALRPDDTLIFEPHPHVDSWDYLVYVDDGTGIARSHEIKYGMGVAVADAIPMAVKQLDRLGHTLGVDAASCILAVEDEASRELVKLDPDEWLRDYTKDDGRSLWLRPGRLGRERLFDIEFQDDRAVRHRVTTILRLETEGRDVRYVLYACVSA